MPCEQGKSAGTRVPIVLSALQSKFNLASTEFQICLINRYIQPGMNCDAVLGLGFVCIHQHFALGGMVSLLDLSWA